MQQDDFDMDGDFTHAVMVAVVLQAVKDAQHGSRGARRWLVTAGRRWTDELGIRPGKVKTWAEGAGTVGGRKTSDSDQLVTP